MQQLSSVCNAVYQVLFQYGQNHSCILGSAVLARTLLDVGFNSVIPLTVRVHIFNEVFQNWIREKGEFQSKQDEDACWDAGGCQIFVGSPEGSEKVWAGHLAVVILDLFKPIHALVDLTITQAERPDHGVLLQPACLKVDQPFLDGGRDLPTKCGNITDLSSIS